MELMRNRDHMLDTWVEFGNIRNCRSAHCMLSAIGTRNAQCALCMFTLVVPLCIVQGTVVVLGHMCPWLVEGHLQIRWAAAHLEICTSSSWPLPIGRILSENPWWSRKQVWLKFKMRVASTSLGSSGYHYWSGFWTRWKQYWWWSCFKSALRLDQLKHMKRSVTVDRRRT